MYVNTGAPFSIGIYEDPYHTQQAYQFDVSNSGAAYIYLPDVSTTDVYVVYVMSTSVNAVLRLPHAERDSRTRRSEPATDRCAGGAGL